MYTQSQIDLLHKKIKHTIISYIGDQFEDFIYEAMCDEIFCDDLFFKVDNSYTLSQTLIINGQYDFDAFSKIITENLKLVIKSYIHDENTRSDLYLQVSSVVSAVIKDIKDMLNI